MFDPETAARTLIPKELLHQASSLHFAMHMEEESVEVLLAESAGGDIHWQAGIAMDKSSDQQLMDLLRSKNWQEKVFRKCTVSFHTTRFTVVPRAFFLHEKAAELLAFSCGPLQHESEYLEIPELDAVLIFETPSWQKDLLRFFPNARILPSAYLLLRYAHSHISAKGNGVFIAPADASMLIAIMKEQHLVLLNHFPVQNEEDVLYHISNAAMRLGLDLETVSIELLDEQPDPALTHLLAHYNRHLNIPFADSGEEKYTCYTRLHILCA